MSEFPDDPRRFPRVPSANAVLVRELGEKEREAFATTRVVGLGGCSFASEQPPTMGSVLELLISLGRRVIRSRARVVYVGPVRDGRHEVGVEFVQLDAADRTALEDLLQHPS